MMAYRKNIKENKKAIVKKIDIIIYIVGLVLLAMCLLMRIDYTICIGLMVLYIFVVPYLVYGVTKSYKVRVFKNHLLLRWGLLTIICLYCIVILITSLIDGGTEGTVPWWILVVFIMCAVQSVINGYIGRNAGK